MIDTSLTFSDNVALTATANSSNVDFKTVAPHGNKPLPLQVSVGTTFTSSGNSTLTVSLEIADNSTFSTNLRSYALTGAVAKSSLVSGYRVVGSLSAIPVEEKFRYARLVYTVNVSNFTAGKLTAFIGSDLETKV